MVFPLSVFFRIMPAFCPQLVCRAPRWQPARPNNYARSHSANTPLAARALKRLCPQQSAGHPDGTPRAQTIMPAASLQGTPLAARAPNKYARWHPANVPAGSPQAQHIMPADTLQTCPRAARKLKKTCPFSACKIPFFLDFRFLFFFQYAANSYKLLFLYFLTAQGTAQTTISNLVVRSAQH